MATINELKEVLKEHQETTGTLNEVRSRIRAEIFNTINNKNPEKAPLSKQNLVINELIREYLLFNNYNYSHATFIPETNQPEQKLDRDFQAKQLNVVEDSKTRQLPLLYSLTFGVKSTMQDDYKNYTQNTFDNNIENNTGANFKTDAGRINDIFSVDNPKPFEYQGNPGNYNY